MRLLVRLLMAAVTLFLILLVGAAIFFWRQVGNGHDRYAAELRLLRRDGLPVRPADVQRPLPPQSLNAAPEWVAFEKLLKAKPIPPDTDEAISKIQKLPAAEQQKTAQYLSRRSDLTELIRQATSKPQCVFQRNWKDGANVRLPEYAGMREAARLTRARSFLLAKEGRYREAVSTQATGFRIAEQAGSDPIVISYLVDIACDGSTLGGMEDILHMAGSNPAVCDEVRHAVEVGRPRMDLHDAMRGEIGLALWARELMKREGAVRGLGKLSDVPSGPASNSLPGFQDALTDASAAKVLYYERRMAENALLPESERRTVSRAFDSKMQKELADTSLVHVDNILAAILAPVLSDAADREYLMHAKEQVIIGAALVLAYKARHGRLPAKLSDALQPPPLDPFTEKPLLYQQVGSGFVLYSVGTTGHYDGHVVPVKDRGREAFFRYPELAASPAAGVKPGMAH